MSDEPKKDNDGVHVRIPGFEGKLSDEATESFMDAVRPGLSSNVHWIVKAVAWAIVIVSTCYGISLLCSLLFAMSGSPGLFLQWDTSLPAAKFETTN